MPAYPYIEIVNNNGLVPGCLVGRDTRIGSTFFKHPYDNDNLSSVGKIAQPEGELLLYIKTIEYKHNLENENPKDYQFDVVLWEERLIEISVGRLQKFVP